MWYIFYGLSLRLLTDLTHDEGRNREVVFGTMNFEVKHYNSSNQGENIWNICHPVKIYGSE